MPQLQDSDALGYLQSQLAYVEGKLWERKYAPIIYPQILPVSFEAGEYATSIEVHYADGVTEGKFIGAAGDDLPYANVTTGRDIIPVRYGGIGYEYTLEELRQSMFLNRPLDIMQADRARRGYEEHAQRVAFFGDSTRGLSGFLNHSAVTTGAASSTFATALGTGTPGDSLVAIFNEAIGAVWSGSQGIEVPDTILIGIARYNTLAGTRMGTSSDMTALKWLQENNGTGQPIRVIPMPQLTTSFVVYSSKPEVCVMHIPMPLRFLPPQPINTKFRVPGEYKLSGVEMRFPGAVLYRTNI